MGHRSSLIYRFILLGFLASFVLPDQVLADSPILTQEENLWLSSRNNTIVVYPEKNNPPFSYQSSSGIIQGLSVDYVELVAENVGAKIHYATPRSRSQILSDIKDGKGDVAISLSPTEDRETSFIFTESFLKVPVIIVVRKDTEINKNVTMNDYTGMRVAVVESSAADEFIRKNYPRVVIETVTDDEVGLQQVVLGEVDAVVMDAASLSFLLSKQVISSVKVTGSLGIDYEPTFAIAKDKAILQSILDKGLMQISASDRQILSEKWILLPGETKNEKSFFATLQSNTGVVSIYVLFGVAILSIVTMLFHRWKSPFYYPKKPETVGNLQEEISELEDTSKVLSQELEHVKEIEAKIAEKMKNLKD